MTIACVVLSKYLNDVRSNEATEHKLVFLVVPSRFFGRVFLLRPQSLLMVRICRARNDVASPAKGGIAMTGVKLTISLWEFYFAPVDTNQ